MRKRILSMILAGVFFASTAGNTCLTVAGANAEQVISEENAEVQEEQPEESGNLEMETEPETEPEIPYSEESARQTVSNGIYNGFIKYEIWEDEETGVKEAALTGVVLDESVGKSYVTAVSVPDTIEGYPVTTIGNGAFSGCENLSSVTFSENVRKLYHNAFSACKALVKIDIPLNVEVVEYHQGNPAYRGPFYETPLSEVHIPEGMTSIPSGLFEGCRNLSQITLPDTVTSIQAGAFAGCSALQFVELKNIRSIGNRAFLDCVSLQGITLPEELEQLDCGAFSGCISITEINIPLNVKLQAYTGANYQYPGPFSGCSGLKSIHFAAGTTQVLEGLFYGCSGLTEVTLPDTITEIQNSAFRNCENLETITFPENLETIRGAFGSCTKLRSVTLPSSLKLLESNAFSDCKALTSIHIPAGMGVSQHAGANHMWPGPFPGCDSLESVTFDEGVQSIQKALFWRCGGLKKVWVPETVAYVGYRTFRTDSLAEIYFEGPAPDMDDSIPNSETVTAYVYSEHWKSFALLRKIYDKVNWKILGKVNPDEIKTGFETELNYSGYAYAYAPLIGSDGYLHMNTAVKYTYEGDKTYQAEAVSDDNGYILFKTPHMTYEEGMGSVDIRQFQFVPAEDETFQFHNIALKVTVTPLQFTQKFQGAAEVGANVSLGVGGGAGVSSQAEVDAHLVKASLGGKNVFGFGVEFDTTGNSADMKLTSSGKATLMTKLSAGVEGKLLGNKAEVLNLGEGVNVGNMYTRGIEIPEIENMTPAKLKKLARFMLCMTLSGSGGNAGAANLLQLLNVDGAEFTSNGITLSAEGAFNAMKLKLGKDGEYGELNIGNIGKGYSGSVSLGENQSKMTKSNQTSMEFKEYTTLNSYKLNCAPMISNSDMLSGTLALAHTENLIKNNNKLNYTVTLSSGETGGAVDRKEAKKRIYALNTEMMDELEAKGTIAKRLNAIRNNRYVLWNLPDYMKLSNDMAANLSEIPMEEKVENTQELKIDFEPKLEFGLGVKVKMGISGLTGKEYGVGKGVYVPDKGARYETELTIADKVNEKQIDLAGMLDDAAKEAHNLVCGLMETITKPIQDGVSYLGAAIKGAASTVKKWKVSITGMKKDKAINSSYQVQSFSSEARAQSGEDGGAAITVGQPYMVSVTEEDDSEVTDFSQEPLTLTLSYTREELEASGLDASELEKLDIYFYDEESGAYICQRGSFNQDTASVTAEIQKPGQYILAADVKAPVIQKISVSNASAKPVITAEIEEMSAISEFSFQIDGQELVNLDNLKNHYNQTSGVFHYPCTTPLAEGEHKLSFHVADEKSMAADQEQTFQVDTTPPEISEPSVSIVRRKVKIQAKASDQMLVSVYATIESDEKQNSYSETIELEEEKGLFTAAYALDRGESCRRVQIFAVDEAGNRSTADVYQRPSVEGTVPDICTGNDFSAYLREDHTLWIWGCNPGTEKSSEVPEKVMDHVAKISCGGRHIAAITEDGALYVWGSNLHGQVGNGVSEDDSSLVDAPVKIMDQAADVSLGRSHSAAITEDGSLYTWGSNSSGELGRNTDSDESAATPEKIMDNVAQVSLGDSVSAAIMKDGALYTWGSNADGMLGNGQNVRNTSQPQEIMKNVVCAEMGEYHSAAITKDGRLYLWGFNDCGQVGDDSTKNALLPREIMDHVDSVALGDRHSAAVTEDGRLLLWGSNSQGQLGRTTQENTLVPQELMGEVVKADCGQGFTAVLKENGSLFFSGNNTDGQCGVSGQDSIGSFTEMDFPEFKKIVMNRESLELKPQETFQLQVLTEDGGEASGKVQWSSTDPQIADVDEKGLVTAQKAGECTVCAQVGGKQASCHVVVSENASENKKVVMNQKSLELKPQETFQLQVFTEDEGEISEGVEWSSTDPQVAGVDQNGLVTAQKEGECTIHAKVGEEMTSCRVVVSETGETPGCNHKFGKWTVIQSATAVKEGSRIRVCELCGETEEGSIARLKPTIKVNVTSIPLRVKQSTAKVKVSRLAKGDYVKSWKSSNTKIVKVNSKGKITAQKKSGKAYVTITLASGLKKKITVNVQKGAVKTKKITGISKTVRLRKGKKVQLKPTVSPITSLERITYTSNKKKIASVSSKGLITARKPGTAKITVKSGKKKVTMTVKVTK